MATPEYGALRAIEPATGERRWEFRYANVGFPGVMSTESGLVFAGDADGNLHAFDSRTGKDLWSHQLGWSANAYLSGAGIFAGPTTFLVGRQYVLIPSGTTLTAFALSEK
jgi:outer membrane protein assembly factor BamB